MSKSKLSILSNADGEQTVMWYSYFCLKMKCKCFLNNILVSYNFLLKVYDLQSPAESLNSFPGCTLTDGSCETMGSSSCGFHGRCLGDWGSFACHCLPGYYGYRCDKGEVCFSVTLLIGWQILQYRKLKMFVGNDC